jgi:class 3 adenylate cyclase
MQAIADWLEKLGMSEYADRFAENRIDLSVLPDLTDQHLKDLGIALGDRLKMLRAIQELSSAVLALPQPAFTPKAQDTAERRQVTVMFSDLVGSTALSARMDPEDLREVISAYQKCVAETVQRFGGFVAKYMGDGVLVYFGYPQAHEDDAERAVRAGLELVSAVTALKTHTALQTRVGIVSHRRRSDRIGRDAGARHRRRDTQHRGAPAGDCRTEHGRHRREHAKTARQSVST